jgi:hypothetical protein
MIRTLAVNCAPILHCSKDDGKTAAENAFAEMVMGAVWALSEFSLLVSQQNHSDLSLKALDDALKRFKLEKGNFREQEMSKSAKATLDNLLVVLATVPDRHFRSGSGSKPNRCQISGPGRQ